MGFAQATSDPCIYIAKSGEPFIIGIYVDDILLDSKTDKRISEVKIALAERFDVKDLGELNYFLGVKMVHNHRAGTIWRNHTLWSAVQEKWNQSNHWIL